MILRNYRLLSKQTITCCRSNLLRNLKITWFNPSANIYPQAARQRSVLIVSNNKKFSFHVEKCLFFIFFWWIIHYRIIQADEKNWTQAFTLATDVAINWISFFLLFECFPLLFRCLNIFHPKRWRRIFSVSQKNCLAKWKSILLCIFVLVPSFFHDEHNSS